jgi:hypothetical protein
MPHGDRAGLAEDDREDREGRKVVPRQLRSGGLDEREEDAADARRPQREASLDLEKQEPGGGQKERPKNETLGREPTREEKLTVRVAFDCVDAPHSLVAEHRGDVAGRGGLAEQVRGGGRPQSRKDRDPGAAVAQHPAELPGGRGEEEEAREEKEAGHALGPDRERDSGREEGDIAVLPPSR